MRSDHKGSLGAISFLFTMSSPLALKQTVRRRINHHRTKHKVQTLTVLIPFHSILVSFYFWIIDRSRLQTLSHHTVCNAMWNFCSPLLECDYGEMRIRIRAYIHIYSIHIYLLWLLLLLWYCHYAFTYRFRFSLSKLALSRICPPSTWNLNMIHTHACIRIRTRTYIYGCSKILFRSS